MSDDVTPNEPAPDAGGEEARAEATGSDASESPTAPETPAIAAGGPAPAELGWGTQPAGALPPGEPPAAPPTAPVAAAPAEPPSERRWSTKHGVLIGLLVLVLGLGGGFAIGRATSDSGPSSLADAVHDTANGDLPLGNTNGSLSQLLQQLERNGGLQRALQDLLGRLPRNGNGSGNNLFPLNPGNGNGNNGNGNDNNGNDSNGNNNGGGSNQTPTTSSAFLGVAVVNSSDGQGVVIQTVQSGSPAADAGLKAGDVITAVDGTVVNSSAALGSAVRAHQPGDSVKITYTRGGTSADVEVRLGNRATANTTVPTSPPRNGGARPDFRPGVLRRAGPGEGRGALARGTRVARR